ncbi:Alpha/Beta hydrolase protein [Podospora australis]|uniref:Alpha/Beta hydrolase protein n=1 Tax=Podospora australis TaxID=1536484 RepID=A0AAN6WZV4_9PEZI|nr:Alpha/Beta hydrolase protein [Podospora australis]
MGFFVRSKKVKKEVKKETPKPSTKEEKRASQQPRALPAPPPPPPPPEAIRNWQRSRGDAFQPQSPFQPAGLLPPPPGWNGSPAYPQSPYLTPAPIIVNQHHYYLGPPPPLPPRSQAPSSAPPPYYERPRASNGALSKVNVDSAIDLAKDLCSGSGIQKLFEEAMPSWQGCGGELVCQGNALIDQISDQLNDYLTLIDQDHHNAREKEMLAWQPHQAPQQPPPSDALVSMRSVPKSTKKSSKKDHPKGQTTAAATGVSGGIFAKVDLYSNSRLPMNLQPLRLYIPTYPLLCLAAQYSERVYDKPTGAERGAHVDADWRAGTKAMVIKSMPMDYMNTIVFAIRGTATFMDWAVNLHAAPASPEGFLDDPNNHCHAGFLSVARKMAPGVAKRLRQLLEEDPNRASYSLLITGHSAGGAVAALLYSHMLASSRKAESELNTVAGFFKRIHCITFGTPPVSIRPLSKPEDYDRRPQLKKSLFLSFINEGDPVARADKAYVKSLLELFATPAPTASHRDSSVVSSGKSRDKSKTSSSKSRSSMSSISSMMGSSTSSSKSTGPVWKVPANRLSSAGRIVVLRSGDPKSRLKGRKKTVEERLNEGVVAHIASDELLRGVIWGDPLAHVMRLYAGRIETLAVGAVTGQGY